jgi:hypothetical protein
MRRWIAVAALAGSCALSVAGNALAYNAVWVESKAVSAGATGVTVGVWVVNDSPLTALVLPLEFRDTDHNGSYISGSCTFSVPAGNRIGASPLTGSVSKRNMGVPTSDTVCAEKNPLDPRVPAVPLCSGPVSNTYKADAPVDFVSPDGFLWAGISTNSAPDLYFLPPGSDSVAGLHRGWPADGDSMPYSAGPSFRFVFSVNSIPGTFEIDTMCVCPANNLVGASIHAGFVAFHFTRGVITVLTDDVRSVGGSGIAPTTYTLEQNYPNPFNASTVVRFSIPHDGRVRLEVFNILGRKVRTLLDDFKPLGLYAVDWDGTDDNGTPVSTGVYLYRIQTADYAKTRSMLLLK